MFTMDASRITMSWDEAITASASHRLGSFATAPEARVSVLGELVTTSPVCSLGARTAENAKSLHETSATEFRAGRTLRTPPGISASQLGLRVRQKRPRAGPRTRAGSQSPASGAGADPRVDVGVGDHVVHRQPGRQRRPLAGEHRPDD